MARRKSAVSVILRTTKALERQHQAQLRAQTKAARDAERARQAYLRAKEQATKMAEKERKAQEKENARLYVEARIAEAGLKNEQLEQEIKRLENLLPETLSQDSYIDLETLKQDPQIPNFVSGKLGVLLEKPILEKYLPEDLTGLKKLVPGATQKHKKAVAQAHERYETDLEKFKQKEFERKQKLAVMKVEHDRKVEEIRKQAADQNAEVEQLQDGLKDRKPEAIVKYFTSVLESSNYPDDFPQEAKLAYVPESKQLVVEYDLPPFDAVPTVGSYKYVKAKDEISETVRPASQRKNLYASVTAQIALRTLHELFKADRQEYLETVVFNGHVDSIDPSTGHAIRPCLITVRTTRDTFTKFDLSKVDPVACLKGLNAGVSKSPSELVPVRPVLEFNMVDPRYVEETDVLSTLDQRPNLMELTPSEFESLITNLFEKMGLETRLTQASRDGGVDCVAYDPRPIFGGKVIIQAKRYKHTVGVSAVRDLYGTLQNEGASKGILVTTSGYGKAAFEFAEGKPLELLSGTNLLYLLAEHAGIEAKIEPPENWKDPVPDTAFEENK